MAPKIEIFVGDVNDVEARVYAKCNSAAVDRVFLRGTLRGPYCDRARTLPAEYSFRDMSRDGLTLAEAVVPDPCTWSPDLPHVYYVDVEARRGERVLAKYQVAIGLRPGSKC